MLTHLKTILGCFIHGCIEIGIHLDLIFSISKQKLGQNIMKSLITEKCSDFHKFPTFSMSALGFEGDKG